MLRPFRLSLPLVLLFISIIAFAQKSAVTQQPKDDEIKILHSNFTYLEVNSANELKVLTGDVQLFHDSSFLYCDSARIEGLLVKAYGKVVIRRSDTVQIFADSLRYDGKAKATDLFGEVILINGGKSLYTRRLHYDLDSSIASYNTPATLRTKQTVLKSKRGYYHVHKDMAYFYGNVQLSDPEIQLRSDSLEFNTSTQTAIFVAPTLMEKNDRKIYCESGYYDVDDKVAEFRGNPQYSELDKKATSDIMLYDGKANEITLIKHVKFVSSDTQLEGDSVLYNEKDKVMTLLGKGNIITKDGTIGSTKKLVYNEKTGQFTTSGRAAIQDSTNQLVADEIIRDSKSGNLTARGNVYWMDTAQHSGILSDSIFLDKASNKVIAIGFNHQPVFKSFSNPADTLYLAADTLIAFQTDSIHKDKNIRAYHKVKVYRSDLQAICDSLIYTEKDSIFTLFNHPIIWSDTSQFFADTIKILQSGNQLQRMYLLQNAMIINSGDLIYFNQIKGRKITADFDSSELSNVDVLGNAEAVYYAIDDDRAYIGVNKIICSHILAKFGSNRVDRIYFFNKPNGTLHPMRSVDHNALKLKGFQWKFEGRPDARLFIERQTQ